MTPLTLAPLTAVLLLLAAAPAQAAANPTDSSASGFPIALVVLAVVATVVRPGGALAQPEARRPLADRPARPLQELLGLGADQRVGEVGARVVDQLPVEHLEARPAPAHDAHARRGAMSRAWLDQATLAVTRVRTTSGRSPSSSSSSACRAPVPSTVSTSSDRQPRPLPDGALHDVPRQARSRPASTSASSVASTGSPEVVSAQARRRSPGDSATALTAGGTGRRRRKDMPRA